MTAQVCPNGAKRTKHHKQRPMQRTNSIQLLDTINATAFSTMLQPQIKPFSVRFSTACYTDKEALPHLPKPQIPLHEIGVKRWQHDLWHKIIEAALTGHPQQVACNWHPALRKPALSRYAATSPTLLAWMRHYNADKPYREQVRPFGFLVSPMARTGLFTAMPEPAIVDPHKRGRPKKASVPKPVAPFDTDPGKAVANAFDRVTGEPVIQCQLKTYAEALFNYHLSSETKFENGAFIDQGMTVRRHVKADSFVLIGKEANKVGESGEEEPGRSGKMEIELGSGNTLSGCGGGYSPS